MSPTPPRALQIMDFEPSESGGPRSIVLHKDHLESILALAGDRKLAVISIAGPSRRGKSFFLSFLIRYLEALEQDIPDWLDWENKDKPLDHGFRWTLSHEHETSGMLMWSKPFIVKQPNEQEVAVLLMDTQGTYDEVSTPRERSAIVGLSLLTSSCLIFNFSNMLQEDCLESLHAYIQYGLMAMQKDPTGDESMEIDSDASEFPFQRLFFLIRDWSFPSKFPYGIKGGKDYLKDKLSLKDNMPEDLKKVRETLQQCFQRMDCFLMPDIGEKAKQEGFNGSLAQISDKFANKLEELVEDLCNPEDVPVKAVFGNDVLAPDFLGYFEQYVAIFNSEETPSPLTLIEATARIANQTLVSQCRRKYLDSMKRKQRGKKFLSDSALDKLHKSIMGEAVEQFGKARKMGGADLISSFREDLIYQLKFEEFDKIVQENEKKRSKLLEDSQNASILSFKKSLDEELEDEDSFVEVKKLKSSLNEAKGNSISDFKEKVSNNLEEEELANELTALELKLDDEGQRIVTDNENRMMAAKEYMEALLAKLVEQFTESLLARVEEDPFVPQEDLKVMMEEEKTIAKTSFSKNNRFEKKKEFRKTYLKKLEESLLKASEEIEKSYTIHIQEAEKQAESLLDDTISWYDDELKKDWDSFLWEAPVAIEESVAGVSEEPLLLEALESFQSKCPIPKDSPRAKEILAKARSKLSSARESVMKEKAQAKKDCEESHVKAMEEAFSLYTQEIEEYVKNTKPFAKEEELRQKHKELKEQAVESYEKCPKLGKHPDPENFLEMLESKIKSSLERSMEMNNTIKEKELAEATNKVNDCQQKYQSEMMKYLETARDRDELDDHHKQCLKELLEQGKKNIPSENGFSAPYLLTLEEEILKSYEELKEIFDLKLMEREGSTNTALADARKFYHEQMEKFVKDNVFMRPKELEELHTRLSKEAIKTCEDATPLSKMQKEDLGTALQQTYAQYKETNDMNVPVDPAIGIDLGTTYSCVGVYHKGQVRIIPNAQGKTTTPSYVCYNDKGFMESVGEPSKKKAYENAENTIYDAKRIIGRKFEDNKLQNDMKYWAFKVVEEGKVPKVQINNGKTFHPEQVSSEILKEMRVQAEKFLGCEVKNAVITVPAYFTDGQRQATIDAGELAGLKVLTILNEPTSAAVAYKLQHSEDNFRHILVFDLGGGTFDVAVLKISKGKIETLAVDGDTHLGGQDFDQNVMQYCCLEFQKKHGIDLMDGKDSTDANIRNMARKRMQRLQQQCEIGKIELSGCRTTDISVDGIYNEGGQSLDLSVTLTRAKFDELNEELFVKTTEIVDRALTSSRLEKSRIDDIVLVGGSIRIPKVQEILQDFFEGKALSKTVNPDEAVAYGAAVQAAIMNGKIAQESTDFNALQDVTPMSLGVEVYGGGFSVIIPKNMKIPTKIKEQYRTAHNNQTSVQITIFQGESSVAVDNNWLGEFYLNGIPPAEAGRETIDVTMEINIQGVLQITAVSTSTGDTESIKVTEDKRRMSKQTIKNILAEVSSEVVTSTCFYNFSWR
jgi:heat shock protein 1/8